MIISNDYTSQNLPPRLGLNDDIPLENYILRMESSIHPNFYKNLKERVQQKSDISDEEFECLLFELKRYFLLKVIVADIEMFSERVDFIWHEMLMFTLDYQKFCENFIGEMIHHIPNLSSIPNLDSRAWFDWVYLQFFKPTAFSWSVWNGFIHSPLNKNLLMFVREEKPKQIKEKLFNVKRFYNNKQVNKVTDLLVERLIEFSKESNIY